MNVSDWGEHFLRLHVQGSGRDHGRFQGARWPQVNERSVREVDGHLDLIGNVTSAGDEHLQLIDVVADLLQLRVEVLVLLQTRHL